MEKFILAKQKKNPRLEQKNITVAQMNGLNIMVLLFQSILKKYYCKKDMDEREKFFKTGFGKKIRNAILKEITQFRPEADQPMAGVRAQDS